uniref:Uncharacterized protein n=1 Tax=Setaria italica TaxID=4555 RepID=K4AH77_SETIT
MCACVFSRQFWLQLLRHFRLPDLAPQSISAGFFEWWQHPGAWTLWKMRNDIVFNGASPRLDRTLLLAQDEADHWMMAGANGLSGLVAARPGG